MRHLIYAINISVDGCCGHTDFSPAEDMMAFFNTLMRKADQVIYGRKTYELMFPYWSDVARITDPSDPPVHLEFAEHITAMEKIVFSKTLQSVEGNGRIIRSNLADEVTKLKQQPGKPISVGGVDLPSQLMELDLIDEYYFVVHPVLVGNGTRLMTKNFPAEKLNLKLVDTQLFQSGAMVLHYIKQ